MNPRDNIVDRVRKLLALADHESGGTSAERELAAERAQALILKHRVEEHELAKASGRSTLPGIVQKTVRNITVGRFWLERLYDAIGSPVVVDVLHISRTGRREVILVGRVNMVAYVELVHGWIEPQLVRECEVALAAAITERVSVDARRFRRSFYEGACSSIGNRLKRAAVASGTGAELVLSDRAAIDAFYGDEAPVTGRASEAQLDSVAVGLGAEAGARVDVDPRNKLDDLAPLELGR